MKHRNVVHRLRRLFGRRARNQDAADLESELRVARRIQFSLVPWSFPKYSEWREFDLHALLSPAREVGGDFYDFSRLDAHRLAIVVGDVSGKGVPASLYMAVCQTALRTLCRDAADPGDLLTRANDMLVRDNTTGRYVTVAVFFVDMPTGLCQYALAGHPAPLLRRAATGQTVPVDSPRSIFIGLKGGASFPTGEMTLHPGDTLLLYTDGVTEERSPSGDELGAGALAARFDRAAERERCQDIVRSLDDAVRGHAGNTEQDDDITLLAFRYWGPGGRKGGGARGGETMVVSKTGIHNS